MRNQDKDGVSSMLLNLAAEIVQFLIENDCIFSGLHILRYPDTNSRVNQVAIDASKRSVRGPRPLTGGVLPNFHFSDFIQRKG